MNAHVCAKGSLDAVWKFQHKRTRGCCSSRKRWWLYTLQVFFWTLVCEMIVVVSFFQEVGNAEILALGVFVPIIIVFIEAWSFPLLLAKHVIKEINVPPENSDPQTIARFVESVLSIQMDWLGQDGHLVPFLKCASVTASAMLMYVWLHLLEIAILADHGYHSTQSAVVKHMSLRVILHLIFCFIVLGFVLIPSLLITNACETLWRDTNDLRCKLNRRLASGMLNNGRNLDSMREGIHLVDDLQTCLRNLNGKQGMGCAMLGIRMSGPLIKAFAVSMASVAVAYLPKVLDFYQVSPPR